MTCHLLISVTQPASSDRAKSVTQLWQDEGLMGEEAPKSKSPPLSVAWHIPGRSPALVAR